MFLNSQNIALLGLGKENQAFLAWLFKHGYRHTVTICDQRTEEQLKIIIQSNSALKKYLPKLAWRVENKFNQDLEDFEVLFRSPGWPLLCPGVQKAITRGVLVTSAMEYFFAACPSTKTIGVTGSTGKGTTATLMVAKTRLAGGQYWRRSL